MLSYHISFPSDLFFFPTACLMDVLLKKLTCIFMVQQSLLKYRAWWTTPPIVAEGSRVHPCMFMIAAAYVISDEMGCVQGDMAVEPHCIWRAAFHCTPFHSVTPKFFLHPIPHCSLGFGWQVVKVWMSCLVLTAHQSLVLRSLTIQVSLPQSLFSDKRRLFAQGWGYHYSMAINKSSKLNNMPT